MTATPHQEAAEAICAALYGVNFVPIGESEEHGGGLTSWFHRGVKPYDVRVSVTRSGLADIVDVSVEWHNLARGAVLRGTQKLTISGIGAQTVGFRKAAEEVVVRVLEIYRDVISETGVAGPIEQLVDTAVSDE